MSCCVLADAARELVWQLRDVINNNDIALTLVLTPCTMTLDSSGVVSKSAARVCRFWPAERVGTDSSPLPVTALMGRGMGGGGGMALLPCAESILDSCSIGCESSCPEGDMT